MADVDARFYASVIREMIRHENDVTNHRLMWLLIVQGLIANAFVNRDSAIADIASMLPTLAILVILSAFVLLYKSYQARGYLQFLGEEAKRGTLPEDHLPLVGWPGRRIRGWRKRVWVCPWFGRAGDLLEPYLFLPAMLLVAWIFVMLRTSLALGDGATLLLSLLAGASVLSLYSVIWVRAASRHEDRDAAPGAAGG